MKILLQLAALRAGGWEGREKETCSADWDNYRTDKTLEAFPKGAEGAERWGWFSRIRAAREPLLGSAYYKLNRQALSAASSPLGLMRSLQRTNVNSPSSPWCFFTCPPGTWGRGRFLEIGEIFSHTLYYPVLSQSSQYTKSRFGGRLA